MARVSPSPDWINNADYPPLWLLTLKATTHSLLSDPNNPSPIGPARLD